MSQKYRTLKTSSGIEFFLGKDEDSNDLLMKEFEGKPNTILHTVAPGSPFCVINSLEFSKKDLSEISIACAAKSQDWRDNQKSIKLHIFTGQQVSKPKGSKPGSWTLKTKPKVIKARKKDIKQWLSETYN
jgi:predicted ribosome quality control (RQC) complex YloA/Tae2 family protein